MERMKAIFTVTAAMAFVLSPLASDGFNGFRADQFPIPQDDPPVQPAGYAFSIWGVIYLWLLAGAVYGLLQRHSDPDWDAMRWPLMGSLVIGAAWIPIAQISPLGHDPDLADVGHGRLGAACRGNERPALAAHANRPLRGLADRRQLRGTGADAGRAWHCRTADRRRRDAGCGARAGRGHHGPASRHAGIRPCRDLGARGRCGGQHRAGQLDGDLSVRGRNRGLGRARGAQLYRGPDLRCLRSFDGPAFLRPL